jgi:hypothetical protein
MKLLAITGTLLCVWFCSAQAKVPYESMEKLRELTVVARVASDFPNSKEIRSCRLKIDFAAIGAHLSLRVGNAKAEWSQYVLNEGDLPLLKQKIETCESRGSCQVFFDYLSATKIDTKASTETSSMANILEEKLSKLTAASYLQAWPTVKRSCRVLRTLF